MRTASREWTVVVVVAALTALASTWPLALRLTTAIPAGTEPPGLTLLGLFVIDWTARVIEAGSWSTYWNAPFFWPHEGTFAWSEPQPLTGALGAAVRAVAGTTLAYNAVWLLYAIAAGVAAYGVARVLTEDRAAAMWPAVWMVGGAYTIQQAAVLNLMATPFPIACVGFVLSHATRPRPWKPWAAAAMHAATFLTCAQYGMFLTILLPAVAIPLVAGRTWTARGIAGVVLPWIVAAAAVGPFLLSQKRALDAMALYRSIDQVRGVLRVQDLVVPADGHWLTGRLLRWGDRHDLYSWDAGVVSLALIVAGLAGGRASAWRDAPRRVLLALIVLVGVSLTLGFGPRLGVEVGGRTVGPYAWLHATVPGWDGIRSPARLGLFVTLGVAVLAAPVVAWLRRRAGGPRAVAAVTAGAFAILAAEMAAMPIPLAPTRDEDGEHDQLISWLRENGGGQPVLELPMSAGNEPEQLVGEIEAVRRALRHGCPVANGYSGHFPVAYAQLRWATRNEASAFGVEHAMALDVRYLVVHVHEPEGSALLARYRSYALPVVLDLPGHAIVELPRGTAEASEIPASIALPRPPREGEILGLPIRLEDGVRLYRAGAERTLLVRWPGDGGREQQRSIGVRGLVLAEPGQPFLYLEVVRFPERGSGGLGRFVPREQVADRVL